MRIPNALTVALAVVALVVAAGVSLAQVPEQMNYQVMLTDDADQPLADQSVQLVFRIYSQVSGGSVLWTETQNVTTNSIGVVSVVLGSVTPLTIDFSGPRWLEIQVGAEVMTPRRPLVAAPYALQADNADNLGGTPAASYPLATTLSTAGTINSPGNPVDWTKLKSVPAGFADGVDNTGGGGGGWVDDGTAVRLETATDNVGIGTTSPQYPLHVENPSTVDGSRAISGISTATTGENLVGVWGEAKSTSGVGVAIGVAGAATGATGGGVGVYGTSASPSGVAGCFVNQAGGGSNGGGVWGSASGVSGGNYGVFGGSNSPDGYGGFFTNWSNTGFAGYFDKGKTYFRGRVGIGTTSPLYSLHVENPSTAAGARAIYGVATPTGDNWNLCGVYGENATTAAGGGGAGVCGLASGAGAATIGVYGYSTSANGYAGYFTNEPGTGYAGYFSAGKTYFGGNVGIGTDSPVTPLDVVATSSGPLIHAANQMTSSDGGVADFVSASPSSSTWTLNSTCYGGKAGRFNKVIDDDSFAVSVLGASVSSEGLYVSGTIVHTALSARAVETSRGTKAVFGVTADEVEVMASGSARLSGGAARVEFGQLFTESVSGAADLRITATPIGAWSALYVQGIDDRGFDLKSDAGDKDVEFHWVAVGRAKGYERTPEIAIPDPEEEARIAREKQTAMISR